MLYQTPALCFPFNHYSTTSTFSSFSPSVSVTATSYPLSLPSSTLPQTKLEMDCVEAKALKGSFRPEMVFMKSSQQAFLDDHLWVTNGPTTLPGGDDLFVDNLLDFSTDDVEESLSQIQQGEKPCSSVSSQEEQQPYQNNSNSTTFSISELTVPADDLADLEWLSHFVEDSFLEFSSPTEKTQNGNQNLHEPEPMRASLKPPCFGFQTPVPCKIRSKLSRRGGRTWSLGSLSFTESSCNSSSSSTSTSPSSTSLLAFSESKHKKKKLVTEGSESHKEQQPQGSRRCSHCYVQKTPQWRTGPFGAKTLCNACGVRYKSGRLLPEYRPACSPTFSRDFHSNSHRKVLEMRQKKEFGFPESDLLPWLRLSSAAGSGQSISTT